jgi:hypothetical protein
MPEFNQTCVVQADASDIEVIAVHQNVSIAFIQTDHQLLAYIEIRAM